MAAPPFLSIIVPFHNSADICAPLLRTLATLDPNDGAELIFVDDGSTDETLQRLREFSARSPVRNQIVERGNGGPGAARNSGLEQASGQWIWFVDCDDQVDLRCLVQAKAAGWIGIDVVAWDFEDPNTRCPIEPGLHETGYRLAPSSVGETIVAKWFSRSFLLAKNIRFPEYCFYEATPLEAFVLPLHVSTYFKCNFAAYTVIEDNLSVTRGAAAREPHFYDRLVTSCLGMEYANGADLPDAVQAEVKSTFVKIFLWYTIRLTEYPGSSWVRAARVMRKFRDEARRFGIRDRPFDNYPGRSASKKVLRLIWWASALLPTQDDYFRRLRMRRWGRDIEWQRPDPPSKWKQAPAAKVSGLLSEAD